MPASVSLSYGNAPVWCFPLFEIAMYILFALCFFRAVKTSISQVSYLIAGVLFGLLLEYVNVISNIGYSYGTFLVMIGNSPLDIPFCIGVGWGIIMYTARLFTDTLQLPLWASACLDALLALSVDVSMDAVAYRMHMWTWNWSSAGLNPLTTQWFGVPYGNFYGWLYVVFFYSAFSRLLEKRLIKKEKPGKLQRAIIPLLSVIFSQIALWITIVDIRLFLRKQQVSDGLILLITLILFAMVLLVNRKKKKRSELHQPFVAWLVPMWFHVYFFAMLFIAGFYKETVWLVIAATGNLLTGIAIHIRSKKRVIQDR